MTISRTGYKDYFDTTFIWTTKVKKLLILLASLPILWTSNVGAADCDAWHFNIVPYFWAVNIHGDIEVGVPAEGVPNQLLYISENFSGILKHVNSGGMIDINASKGNFGLFTSAMYVSIKNINVTTSDGFEVQVNSKFGLFSAGAFYHAYEYQFEHKCRVAVGPYVGARYTRNESGATLIEAPEYSSSYDAHWTEPFIGATLLFDINQNWSINLAGDIGVFKRRQESYNIIGLIDYKLMQHLNIYLGYRQLYQSFTEGSGATFFEWRMHVSGPIIGFALGF